MVAANHNGKYSLFVKRCIVDGGDPRLYDVLAGDFDRLYDCNSAITQLWSLDAYVVGPRGERYELKEKEDDGFVDFFFSPYKEGV